LLDASNPTPSLHDPAWDDAGSNDASTLGIVEASTPTWDAAVGDPAAGGNAAAGDAAACEAEITTDGFGCTLSYPIDCRESMRYLNAYCSYDDFGPGQLNRCHCDGLDLEGSYIYDNSWYSNRPDNVTPTFLLGEAACWGVLQLCIDAR
jgi:hypothetical protein